MSARLPQLESLRVFEAAARQGSFSRAASELGVTPAAVSLRVRLLENELGQKLFDRYGPKVSLTEPGEKLAVRLAEAFTITQEAVTSCRTAKTALRVTAAPTFASRWLAPRLLKYRALPDSVPIRLEVATDVRKLDEFDVAFRSGKGNWPGLRAENLMPIERTPMLAPALAMGRSISKPFDLAQLPLLRDDHWEMWFQAAGMIPPRMMFAPVEYTTQDMAAQGVLGGVGAALLSPALFGSLISEGLLVRPFLLSIFTGEAFFALRREKDRRMSVEHFIKWVRTEASI